MLEKFGKDGTNLNKMDAKQFKAINDEFGDRVKKSLNKTTGHRLMKDYSPWLSSFQANQHSEVIEIPGQDMACGSIVIRMLGCVCTGQYDGQSKPLPEYHTKIAGFDEKVWYIIVYVRMYVYVCMHVCLYNI